jgi:hypothetical protein
LVFVFIGGIILLYWYWNWYYGGTKGYRMNGINGGGDVGVGTGNTCVDNNHHTYQNHSTNIGI